MAARKLSLLEQPTSEDPNEQPDCRVVIDMCIRNVLSSLHVDLHYWLLHAAAIMTGNNKIAVVLGESGAGKTTLFRKLAATMQGTCTKTSSWLVKVCIIFPRRAHFLNGDVYTQVG